VPLRNYSLTHSLSQNTNTFGEATAQSRCQTLCSSKVTDCWKSTGARATVLSVPCIAGDANASRVDDYDVDRYTETKEVHDVSLSPHRTETLLLGVASKSYEINSKIYFKQSRSVGGRK